VERPTFLFDGDCAFCSSCARFIDRHIRPSVHVLAWQFADLGGLGLTADECETAVQFVAPGRPATAGPAAIADLLRSSGGLWRPAGRLLGLRPVTALAWPVYNWVARNRHRMPGGTAACAVPRRPAMHDDKHTG
jgi:predicted DCC family thiol-disulfide oxidoreductase YuxK